MRSWNREQHRATPDFSSKVDVMLNPETESPEKFWQSFPSNSKQKGSQEQESSRRRCKGGTFSTNTTRTTARTTVFSCNPRKIFEANQPLEAGRGLQKNKKAAAEPLTKLSKEEEERRKGNWSL
ncbi:unnamed protein product [Musa acuminata var. zebrina]